MKKTETVRATAWAFLTSDGAFILDPYNSDTIYFKKPPAKANPFDYSFNPKKTWKPTKIAITYSFTA